MKSHKIYTLILVMIIIIPTTEALSPQNSEIKPEDWKVTSGLIITYFIEIKENELNSTCFEKIFDQYHFNNTYKDFFGAPQIIVKINNFTNINNIANISYQIFHLTGPTQIDQKFNDTWEEKTSILFPFVIPINHWNDLLEAFKNLEGVQSVEGKNVSGNGKVYEYTIQYNEVTNTGIAYFNIKLSWQKDTGILDAFNMEIEQNQLYDKFSLNFYSKKNSENNFSISKIFIIIGIIAIIVIIQIFIVKKMKEKNRGKKKSSKFLSS
ncbi:MAG: hypothetical protein ACTSXK_17470 [Promethearchaeota archaeon]